MDPESAEYELARRARDGDQEALAQLVEQERLPLFTLAYAHLRHYHDAQDVLAAAVLQICLHVRELRAPDRVRAWMQTIVRNEARQCRRRALPEPIPSGLQELCDDRIDDHAVSAPGPEAAASLLRLDILRALRRLPWDEARAVALFYLVGLPIREIAQHLRRPEGTIKRWLHLGRQHLAAELEEYAPREFTPRRIAQPGALPFQEEENDDSGRCIQ
jgi:RNA polymerase sigma-70 factor (ECF subfamily)